MIPNRDKEREIIMSKLTLSERVQFLQEYNKPIYLEKDIKQFIKDIKQGIEDDEMTYTDDLDRLFPIIDNLAGKELIE